MTLQRGTACPHLQPDGNGSAVSSSPPNAVHHQAKQLLRTLDADPAARAAWATPKRQFDGADSDIDLQLFSININAFTPRS